MRDSMSYNEQSSLTKAIFQLFRAKRIRQQVFSTFIHEIIKKKERKKNKIKKLKHNE